MKFLKAIWKDPVGSVVIAQLIYLLLITVASCINWPHFLKTLMAFWTVGIPFWISFLSLLIVMAICYAISRR